MSLKVWLPLTEDTKNQGLLNLPTPWDARTRDIGGKLGQYCYSDNAIYHIENEWLGNEWSLACWVKSSSWSPYNDIILCKNTTSSGDVQFYLSIVGGTWLNIGCNAGSETLKINYTFAIDTWYHIAATYDGITLKLYLNGSEIGTKAYASTQKTGMNNLGIGCRSTNATGTSATGGASKRMNDVRIYDHCLSPLEVKQISQGLVLHYPLNRNGFGVDNILVNTHFDSHYSQSTGWDTTKNGTQLASSWGGYNGGVSNSSTVYHAHLKKFNGEWVYEYIKTANENWLGISQSGLQSKLTAGKTYTFSWEEYHVNGTNRVGTGLYYYKTGATSANFHLGIRESAEVIREIGRWQKYIYTFTAPSDADWSKNMTWYIYGHCNGNGTFYVRHIKLEEGSVATPWCPNSSDTFATTMGLNDNIEYDTSGYGNNGTKVGTFSYNSDTPKYNVSTKFTIEPNAISFASNFSHLTTFTYSCWIKTNVSQSAYLLMGYQYGNNTSGSLALDGTQGGFHYYAHAGTFADVTIKGSANCCDNQWHMITATYDGSKVITYIDGVKTAEGTVTLLTTVRTFSLNYPSGASGRYFNGLLSDARVYATVLSAEDIKSLYNNSAYIDNQGNIYGAVYEEV